MYGTYTTTSCLKWKIFKYHYLHGSNEVFYWYNSRRLRIYSNGIFNWLKFMQQLVATNTLGKVKLSRIIFIFDGAKFHNNNVQILTTSTSPFCNLVSGAVMHAICLCVLNTFQCYTDSTYFNFTILMLLLCSTNSMEKPQNSLQ